MRKEDIVNNVDLRLHAILIAAGVNDETLRSETLKAMLAVLDDLNTLIAEQAVDDFIKILHTASVSNATIN